MKTWSMYVMEFYLDTKKMNFAERRMELKNISTVTQAHYKEHFLFSLTQILASTFYVCILCGIACGRLLEN